MHDILKTRLIEAEKYGAFRSLVISPKACGKVILDDGGEWLNFSSNDYLNLSQDSRIITAAHNALDEYGAGSNASRLMSGNLNLHEALESKLASYCKKESALIFGSGFLCNAGIVAALAKDSSDCIFADKLVHASLIDGIRFSGAAFHRFRHNDVNHLEHLLAKNTSKGIKIVIFETVYSMDGDIAPVAELIRVAKKYNAVVIADMAHGVGIFPVPTEADIITGTLGKSLGAYGGFCAVSKEMRDYLINFARTFIFSTALPPSVIAAAMKALEITTSTPSLGRELLKRSKFFSEELSKEVSSEEYKGSQIIPFMMGDNIKTLSLATAMSKRRIFATAIRPPTVPPNTARIRFSVTLAHSYEDLKTAARILNEEFINVK